MRPGRHRRQAIDCFWISVYNGFHVGDLDSLQARSFAPAEYLSAFDELHELSESREDQNASRWSGGRRQSAVTGMGVLALE
jgi:hypothetical protein